MLPTSSTPTPKTSLKLACERAAALRMWSTSAKLMTYAGYLFDGIAMSSCRFLDVGGGLGLFAGLASALGAKRSVCVEPGGHGASDTIRHSNLEGNGSWMEGHGVELYRDNLTEFGSRARAQGWTFDVILLHNVINHLDEAACQVLHQSEAARLAYLESIRQMSELAAPQAWLILCACARNNLFPDLHLRNPFMPTIEWHKH
ncbi:MAG: hypothetical protein FJ404_19655 [Verrucomicrobia bacterium]|nr:hypothetical protein [Verrucomicrobiota bacterium]